MSDSNAFHQPPAADEEKQRLIHADTSDSSQPDKHKTNNNNNNNSNLSPAPTIAAIPNNQKIHVNSNGLAKKEIHHPMRSCILWSFLSGLCAITLIFFLIGFQKNRPLLGPLFIAAVIPSLFIIFVSYRKEVRADDRYARGVCSTMTEHYSEMVPLEVLIIAFSLGIAVTLPVGIIGGLIQNTMEVILSGAQMGAVALFFYIFVDAFIFTACLEEGAKYACGRLCISRNYWQKYVTHPYGVMLFCLSVALGFAALENVTYVFGEKNDESSWALAVVRALLAVPLHGTTGAIIGVGLARRYYFEDENFTFVRIMTLPVFIHGLYDFVWMAPIRAGPFQGGTGFQTSRNTVDIGSTLLTIIHLGNVCLVFIAASYAIQQSRKLREDYINVLQRDQRAHAPLSGSGLQPEPIA